MNPAPPNAHRTPQRDDLDLGRAAEVPVIDTPDVAPQILAKRSARLWGALIDAVLTLSCGLPFLLFGFGHAAHEWFEAGAHYSSVPLSSFPVLLFVLLGVALTALQAVLITRRGQSIGKIVMKTRIVRVDGSAAGFLHGVLLRHWSFMVAGTVLPFSHWLALFDSLLVFRKDRRCLHDHVAGTRVIQAW